MKIVSDSERYDELQMRMLEEIIASVRDELRKAGITDDSTLSEVLADISFAVAAIVDGSRPMEWEGKPVIPVLTFATERDGDTLIVEPNGSWMHEYVFGTVDDMFEQEDE